LPEVTSERFLPAAFQNLNGADPGFRRNATKSRGLVDGDVRKDQILADLINKRVEGQHV
jgi:hypothetical protein